MPCSDPPGVKIFGYAPQFNAKNFSHIFVHGNDYEIPGKSLLVFLGTSDKFFGGLLLIFVVKLRVVLTVSVTFQSGLTSTNFSRKCVLAQLSAANFTVQNVQWC